MTNFLTQKPGGNITLNCEIKEFYGKIADGGYKQAYLMAEPFVTEASSYFCDKNIEIYCRTHMLNEAYSIKPGTKAVISGLFDCAWVKKPNTVCILLSYIDSLMIEALSAA